MQKKLIGVPSRVEVGGEIYGSKNSSHRSARVFKRKIERGISTKKSLLGGKPKRQEWLVFNGDLFVVKEYDTVCVTRFEEAVVCSFR